eukprot:COSAG02_NODE_546_length_20497_cov_41.264095_14_plen_87_part_00
MDKQSLVNSVAHVLPQYVLGASVGLVMMWSGTKAVALAAPDETTLLSSGQEGASGGGAAVTKNMTQKQARGGHIHLSREARMETWK